MPDRKTAYWLGRLDDQSLIYLLRELGHPEARIRRRWPTRQTMKAEVLRRYAFRVFGPAEIELAGRWRAPFRDSELVLFDDRHHAHFQMFGLKPPVISPSAVLSCGVRREPLPAAIEEGNRNGHHRHP
jgi:hypothetical protein